MTADSSARSETGAPGTVQPDRAQRLADCLQRARAGEMTALDEVVRELNPLLWHVARSQGMDQSQAYDVVQTAWLELLRRLDGIRSPQALTAWLITTTKREAWRVKRLAHRSSGSDELAGVPDPAAPQLDERLITDARDRTLWAHFQQLSQRCRELLRIVALVDRPDYAVVSEALAMPHGSIGPTRGRCLAKLREMLLADPAWSTDG
jgi:RNA polymerase sigma factor (sigma-70 family)